MFSETNIRKGQSCKCNPVLDLSEEDKDQGGLLHRIA